MSGPPSLAESPAILRVLGRALVVGGALSLMFAFFQLNVAGITEKRSQRSLRGGFALILRSGAPLGAGSDGRLHAIAKGSPIGLIEVPAIGVNKMVVEGTGAEQLKKGPGHLATSFLPGHPGHAVIVGRRTTYGAPFKRLDVLRQGDEIFVTTPYGRFPFRVRKTTTLEPGKADNLATSKNGLLTLVTSDPPYAPHSALVVEAELTSDPSNFPNPPLAKGRAGAVYLTGNIGALPGVALSGMLLVAAIAIAQVLYQRWRAWPTYLLTTPVVLALLFMWMEGLVSIMPATL